MAFLASGGSAKEIIDQEMQKSVVALRKDKQDRLRRVLGISSSPNDTIKAGAHLGSDLEGLADAVPVLGDEAVEAEAMPHLPPSLFDANKKLREILDKLPQASPSQASTVNDAEATPRPPPGLDTAQETITRNLEQLYLVVPAPSIELVQTHDFPQYSLRPNGIEAVMQSNLEKLVAHRGYKTVKRTVTDKTNDSHSGDSRPSSAAGNISPISAEFLWDSPNYDIDAWHARTQAQTEKERASPPLDPGLVYTDSDPDVQAANLTNDTTPDNAANSADEDQQDDPEADIHAWFAKYQSASYAPQLGQAIAEEGQDASIEDDTALVSANAFEGSDEQSNEELEQAYLGSNAMIDAGGLDLNNDRRLTLYRPPIIAVEQVLGPGEVWDDEDDVEIIC